MNASVVPRPSVNRSEARQRSGPRRHSYDASEFQHDSDSDAEVDAEPEAGSSQVESPHTVSEFEEPADSGAAAEATSEENADPGRFEDVIGWQPLLLNRAIGCAGCATRIERGAQGYVGVTAQGLSPSTLCQACVDGL